VDDDVESHEFPEGLVGHSEHVCVVGTIIECGVCLRDVVLVLVAVVEDDGGDAGHASAHIEGVFESGVPVLVLMDAVGVGLGELAHGLASEDTHRQLGHGVHVLGEVLDQILNIGGELAAVEELSLELVELGLGGELASEEEPEGGLWEGL
jgi:hypothetical protein